MLCRSLPVVLEKTTSIQAYASLSQEDNQWDRVPWGLLASHSVVEQEYMVFYGLSGNLEVRRA